MLGPVDVSVGGAPVALGPRARALLALLLLHAPEPVPWERLIDGIWGESAPERARNALQVQAHGLRRQLGADRIETLGGGYRVVVDREELDVVRFEQLVRRARTEDPAAAAETLRAALALWRGPALADVDAPFASVEAGRLEEERFAALEGRVDADLACGRHADVIAELEALVAEHPFRERLRGQLMTALYRSGRQADALAAYRAARDTMLDELGIEPGEELRELERAILRHDPALAPPPPPGGRSSLPAPARPLIGRQLELAAVVGLLRLEDVRLVTVTGPGGTGKTRLALEAAHELAPHYRDGAYLVDLAAIREATLVPSALAESIGLSESSQEIETALAARLADRRTLLFMDNFEHVVEAAPILGRLVAAVPSLDVLVTSRSPLRVAAEHEYRLLPLALPERGDDLEELARNEAASLFLARASAVSPAFELTPENAPSLVELCHALDGLPLAIELAAARVNVLSPRAIADRLGQRLDLLAAARRDAPVRQHTLRATMEWSHDLLDERARLAFARLATFSGGFTLDAAEQVCGAGADDLAALVDQSLLLSRPTQDGELRFTMLETIREYALERLRDRTEAKDMARAHCEHYLALAEEAAPRLFFDDSLVARLEQELGNLRAALAWSRDADADLYLGLGIALWRFWYLRGFLREGLPHLEDALARAGGAAPAARADGWKAAAILAVEQLALDRGAAHAQRALDAYRELGDERGVLTALTVLGNGARQAGATDDAQRFFEESGAIARRLGLQEDVAVALANLATLALDEEDYERASELVRESLEINRAAGRTEAIAIGLGTLAYVELRLGRNGDAAAAAAESAAIAHRLGFREMQANSLVILAAAVAEEDPEHAARLLGAVDAVAAATDERLELRDRSLHDDVHASVRARIGDSRLASALAAGREAPLDELLPDGRRRPRDAQR